MAVVSPLICNYFMSHDIARISSKVTVFTLNPKGFALWNSYLQFVITTFFSAFLFRFPPKLPFLLYHDVHSFQLFPIILIVYKLSFQTLGPWSPHVWRYTDLTKCWQERCSSSTHSTFHSKFCSQITMEFKIKA